MQARRPRWIQTAQSLTTADGSKRFSRLLLQCNQTPRPSTDTDPWADLPAPRSAYRDEVLTLGALLSNGYPVREGDTIPCGWNQATGERCYIRVTRAHLTDARTFIAHMDADTDDD